VERLTTKLNYTFKDDNLLQLALTHRSKSARNYERLEFLGDSILSFLIAEALYERFPLAAEGVLSRIRADLVRKQTLAEVARRLDLGSCIELGSGELRSGGFNRDSILADSFEAVIGAVYQDGGLDAARRVVLHQFSGYLRNMSPESAKKDPKSKLQELLQKHALDLPVYEIIEVRGEPHCQHFVIECLIENESKRFQGEGTSRRGAEQDAAGKAFEYLSSAYD